jgi:mRNA interferase MazF
VRGDVYRLRAPRNATGHEQRSARYAVVLQADALAPLSTWIIAPTSTSAPGRPFRPEIAIDGTKTRVVLDQLTAVDRDRLGDIAGRVDPHELGEIDAALRGVLGLF